MLIKRFSLFASLWLIPSFILWYVSYQSVLLPTFQTILRPIIAMGFVTEQAKLHTKDNGWEVATTILTPDQPSKNAQRIRVQNIKVEKVVIYTSGFPLLWLLLFASATHRPRNFFRNFLIGNAVLFGCVAFFLWLKIILLIMSLLSEPNTQIYIVTGIIKPAIPYPSWLIVSLQFLQTLFAYFCAFIVPIATWYFLLNPEDQQQLVKIND
jgi:hypothetical protein